MNGRRSSAQMSTISGQTQREKAGHLGRKNPEEQTRGDGEPIRSRGSTALAAYSISGVRPAVARWAVQSMWRQAGHDVLRNIGTSEHLSSGWRTLASIVFSSQACYAGTRLHLTTFEVGVGELDDGNSDP